MLSGYDYAHRPDGFSKRFASLVAGLALPRVRFHDLRHSYASQLLAGGRIFSSHGLARSFDKNGGNFGITYFRFECNSGHVLYKTQRDLTSCMEGCISFLKSSVRRSPRRSRRSMRQIPLRPMRRRTHQR